MALIEQRINKDSNVSYRVKVRLKGFPAQTATFKRITDSKKWATQTEAAIQEGRHFKTTQSKKYTLNKLIDKYIAEILPRKQKSMENQLQYLNWWKSQIGGYVLADVNTAL